jgi:lipopolysaccharide/colanic/teichoic acid biosynthesis glycosyltransferase
MTSEIRNGLPRFVDLAVAICGLIVTAPLIGLCAVVVVLTSRGSAIFRQTRVGRGGRNFTMYKLRTMRCANAGPEVTASNDKRITLVGKFLRKTKIDELPGLWSVLKGDMALVGPRPEVPRYVDLNNAKWVAVLKARPGITDPVTIQLRNEEELLAMASGDPEQFYLSVLQPLKLAGYVKYLSERSWRFDLHVLWGSFVAVIFPHTSSRRTLGELSLEVLGYERNSLDNSRAEVS